MKNIQKKWMLLVTATFVTFLGICYTFFKETSALEEEKCGVYGFRVNEGEIDFDINKYEYTVTVSDFDKFNIELISDEVLNYAERFDYQNMIVTYSMTDFCGKDRVYTFKVFEDPNILVNKDKDNDNGFDYTFIFVIIIFILIAFNIYRMIRIIKGKKK